MKSFDVYSFGVIAPSVLYLLAGDYPAESGYAEFSQRYQNVGGEAANSSIVLARLGLSVGLDGNWINPDEDAQFLYRVFEENGIDISRVVDNVCRAPKEIVVVTPDSRTIFGSYATLAKDKSWNRPTEADIQAAHIVNVDPFFGEASLEVVRLAKEHGKTTVTVDCKHDDVMYLETDIAVISAEFIRDAYPHQDVDTVLGAYRRANTGVGIFTFGSKGIRYTEQGGGYQIVQPYVIDPVDTAGAGDSFRAGIVYGTLQGWPVVQSIRFASAVAALVCQTIPGVLHSPSYEDVIAFMGRVVSGR